MTLDWKLGRKDKVEFTFQGIDEGDEVCGKGWAKMDSEKLIGRIRFHQGDQSGIHGGEVARKGVIGRPGCLIRNRRFFT